MMIFLTGLLRKVRENTIKQILIYAKRFASVLATDDASPLTVLSPRNRQHAMVSLANLAKYQGCYDKFLLLKQRYSMKWKSGNDSLQPLQRFFNTQLTLDKLLDKIREMMRVLPPSMAAVVRHACLTGLRPSEACESARLIQNKSTFTEYYDPVGLVLCHYKFPQQFLRTTKKAFVSYITLDNLQPIAQTEHKTLAGMR
jgi:hypothetical protein